MEVITTCSPPNFDLVKSFGADHVLDYRSEGCMDAIKRLSKNSLRYAIDCISEPETMEFCYRCIGRAGGRLTTLEPPPRHLHTRPRSVHLDWVLAPVLVGKPIGWPAPMGRPADPEMREFAKTWFATAQELLDAGKLRAHPQQVMDGGLPGILEGLELIKKHKISGQKLVYPLL